MGDVSKEKYKELRAELDELRAQVGAVHTSIDKIEQKLGR